MLLFFLVNSYIPKIGSANVNTQVLAEHEVAGTNTVTLLKV